MKPDEKRFSLMELAATLDGVISLGRGDPDLDTPPHIIEQTMKRMAEPPDSLEVRGLEELRLAVAKRYRDEKNLDFDPETEILVTNGAQEGLFLSVLALLNPGDEILVPDPRYGSYDQAIATAGGEMVPLPTGDDHHFGLRPQTVAETNAGKVLLLVNPSNPTGALTPGDDVREIAKIAVDKDLIVISDEVYEKLTFGEEVLSVAACEEMRERTVTLSSLSKTYAMTGFRIGYLIGPPPFIEAAERLKANVSGPTALLSQFAGIAALEGPQDVVETYRQIYAGRLRVMREGFDRLGIPYGKPGGGFFLWADVSRFGIGAERFCRELLTNHRVLMFPGTAFGERWSNYVRISLLQPEERIEEAVGRIEAYVRSIGA